MSLEKNIERIADALEALAKMGSQSPEKNNAAVSQQGAQRMPVQPPVQQAPAPLGNWQEQQPMQGYGGYQQPQGQQPLPQGGQVPVSPSAGTGTQWPGSGGVAPAGNMPIQQPQNAGMVPTTASAQPYTFDQLAVATANLASSGRDVFTILGRFGVSMLMDLPQEKYGEYAAALREAGAVI